MTRMTGAKFFADTLKGYGVTHVFVSPSVANLALAEASAIGIKNIVPHGEKPTAYMADGYARATNRPGVCIAQSVGAANMAAGLQDAFLALSPVIALTGRKTPMEQYRNAYQEVAHAGLYDPVTKFSGLVETLEQFPHMLRLAFREVTSGATAPVHLDLQGISAHIIMESEAELEVLVEEQFNSRPAFRPEPSPELVAEAAKALASANRPIIVAGGGVTASGAQAELTELAEKLSIPVATALNAKGAIPDNHPLAVGTPGTYSRACANRALYEADLVLFVGSHTGSQVTTEWTIPAKGMRIIQIDIDPIEIGRSYPVEVGLQGDAKATLRRLIDASEAGNGRAEWVARAQRLVQEWRDQIEPRLTSDAVPIIPDRLCAELTAVLDEKSILVVDTGHAGIWTAGMIDFNNPGQMILRCAGSLGWGLPASIGAQLARPDKKVVCFTGDGGIWYHIGEIETAVRCGAPVTIVVNNNSGYIQDKGGDDISYAKVPGTDSAQLWQFNDTNFAKLAENMGALGIRVEQPGDIRSAIEEAMASGRTALVDVATDPADGNPPERWNPPG